MQIQIFTIPVLEGDEELTKMNKFLRSHRVAEIKRQQYVGVNRRL